MWRYGNRIKDSSANKRRGDWKQRKNFLCQRNGIIGLLIKKIKNKATAVRYRLCGELQAETSTPE